MIPGRHHPRQPKGLQSVAVSSLSAAVSKRWFFPIPNMQATVSHPESACAAISWGTTSFCLFTVEAMSVEVLWDLVSYMTTAEVILHRL